MIKEIYITGAGVSSASGIPTFRGKDGFWTIGSKNYTPQEMATRKMYFTNSTQFLLWYYKRFIKYRNSKPNEVHHFLSDKRLITQNIDGLDKKAGNKNFIAIHGDLHKVTKFHEEGSIVDILDAPWNIVEEECPDNKNIMKLKKVLLDVFKISKKTKIPEVMKSLKPFVLLFDEFYTEIYKINLAYKWLKEANKFIFLGTSFSVNFTSMALKQALLNDASIEIVDPKPIDLGLKNVIYHKISAQQYVKVQSKKK